ncbi:MerR family DNA-binding transcriptional regulator [Phreatobacter aquaticus]|uniref:MerR family DNA-binding transcriptional regulator n=1 Tax=Phreatobacter aquaticus TaxID=2570229 RepID=A0A4D7QGA3_9HYPH|nr:MerR family DNA-binding transcriptional regulator [Phreatobacter aquaticus]QCK85741.1 MerR family DNA-binding transcriptional regulator [Phreatobacter aquaticus]
MATAAGNDIAVRGAGPSLSDLVASVGGQGAHATKDILTMREMTRAFGLTARSLRFYEEKGLIAPERQGQDRLYSRRDRGRLRLVLMGKCVGFSLEEVKAMLDLYDLGDGGVTQLKVARGKFLEQVSRLHAQKRDIDSAITELERAVTFIDQRLAPAGADRQD